MQSPLPPEVPAASGPPAAGAAAPAGMSARPAAPFPLKQVLVFSDLSPAATNAAWRGALLARDHGAWLRILHVSRRGAQARRGQEALDALAWELRERLNIAVLAQSVRSGFRREILAATRDADLLVVRTAQGRPAADWLGGLHPERLVQRCQVPTLVVRKPATVSYRRVLVGVGFDGEAAAGLIATAAAMTRAPHAEVLEALASGDDLTQPRASTEAQLRGDRHHAAQRIRAVVEGVMEATGGPRAGVAPSVAFDHSPAMLLEKERAVFADLLVIGRPPRATPALWLPRTDSRSVLAGTGADVLVLPMAYEVARPAGAAVDISLA